MIAKLTNAQGLALAVAHDWTPHRQWDENTNHCACGAVWRSHHKIKMTLSYGMVAFTEKPCPVCGSHTNVRKSESGPERMTLSKHDIGESSNGN